MYDTQVRVRAVIFDMDGLTLDTDPLHRAAWKSACTESGYALSDAVYMRLIGRARIDAEQILLKEFGSKFSLDSFRCAYLKDEKAALAAGPIIKKPGVNELLMLLDSRRIPKAVATSTERQIDSNFPKASGLLSRFESIAGGTR
ncbi:MAG: HAD family phosphatase [Candidatus Acidiferrales bacterium]